MKKPVMQSYAYLNPGGFLPDLSLNDWVAYGLLLILLVVFLSTYLIKVLKRKSPQSQTGVKTKLDAILHRSSERGEGVLLGLSEGSHAQTGSLAGLVGLQTQAHVFQHSLISDIPPKALAGEGTLVALSQQLTSGTYSGALMPELFNMDSSGLAGIGSYAYLAGLLPELSRPNLTALVMQGELSPELVLALDMAERHGLDCIVSSTSISGQTAGFVANEDAALGPEAFLSQSNHPRKRAGIEAAILSLKIIRGIIVGGLFIAIMLYFLGVLP